MTSLRMDNVFRFSTALDSSVLSSFYDGDLNYALMMFEIFLVEIPGEIDTLRTELEQENLEGCRRILHKIKPNFVMVGNEPLTDYCTKIEKGIKEGQYSMQKVAPEIESIVEEINQTLILLEQETNDLKQFLNQ